MAEVHDCFTPAELLIMEDLGFAERGTAWKEVLDGTFDLDGELPVNPDGGLKSFGHPVGASGLRMVFEAWLQMRGRGAARSARSTTDRKLALTHNLGGYPGEMVSFVGLFGPGSLEVVNFDFSDEQLAFAKEVEQFLDEHDDPEVFDLTRENMAQIVDTPEAARVHGQARRAGLARHHLAQGVGRLRRATASTSTCSTRRSPAGAARRSARASASSARRSCATAASG